MSNPPSDHHSVRPFHAIAGPLKQDDPVPDEQTKKELDKLARAREQGKLPAKALAALESIRHSEFLENALKEEREERLRLQADLDDLKPKCRSLQAIQKFDTGITFWAAIAAALGNGLMAYAGFHDNEPHKSEYLWVGIVISGLATLFILGIHKLWIPKASDATD